MRSFTNARKDFLWFVRVRLLDGSNESWQVFLEGSLAMEAFYAQRALHSPDDNGLMTREHVLSKEETVLSMDDARLSN